MSVSTSRNTLFPYTTLFRSVAGGVIGGVLGHQVGSGRGNTAATVVGAGAGAYAGNEIEKNKKAYTTHDVTDRKSTRLNSSHPSISYAVFCMKKKNTALTNTL